MICAALLNLAPAATAAEQSTDYCPFTNPALCLVWCTAENQSVKPCVELACTGDLPTVCYVFGEVWSIVP